LRVSTNLSLSFDTPKRESFFTTNTNNNNSDAILGKGTYGVVYTASYKMKNVAVKVINKQESFKLQSLKRESNIISWRHPNIIKIFKIVETEDYGAVIMEQFENAKPLQYVLDHTRGKVDLFHRCRILRDIGSALDYCHSNQVCHADLKPLNIMIVVEGEDYICKLFDFGCSVKIGSDMKTSSTDTTLGTARYCAPEILQGFHPTTAADIYSFGILMWQLKENEIPFDAIKCQEQIIWQVVKNQLRPDSTVLLLSEMNENFCSQKEKSHRSYQYCNSDLFDTLKISPQNSLKQSRSANKKFPRTEVMKKRDSKPFDRSNLKHSRKVLFVENLQPLPETTEISTPKCFQNLFSDKNLQLRHSEKLFHIENNYIQLYKRCWHTDPMMRPNLAEIMSIICDSML
jgi:calcium-dependent protein kinase